MFTTNQPPKNIGLFGMLGGSFELTSPHFGTFIKQLLGNELFVNMRKIALVVIHNPIIKRILQNILFFTIFLALKNSPVSSDFPIIF